MVTVGSARSDSEKGLHALWLCNVIMFGVLHVIRDVMLSILEMTKEYLAVLPIHHSSVRQSHMALEDLDCPDLGRSPTLFDDGSGFCDQQE